MLEAGWEHVKPADGYDDAYYRRWMHELPPLIHRTRDRMIDVHHTILPLTARPRPDAGALIAASVALENGLRMLSPADMIVHAAAHLFADGDLAGGLRNLWDIDRLLREFAAPDFWPELGDARAPAPACWRRSRAPCAWPSGFTRPRWTAQLPGGSRLDRPPVRGPPPRPQRLGAGEAASRSASPSTSARTGCACRR